MYVAMYVATQLQLYTRANTCSIQFCMGSYIASYLFPYLLCRSLLPLLNLKYSSVNSYAIKSKLENIKFKKVSRDQSLTDS